MEDVSSVSSFSFSYSIYTNFKFFFTATITAPCSCGSKTWQKTQQTGRILFQTYSRDLRVVPEKLPPELVFPSHIVTELLVFCIQYDSHHWFVEEWHQVSSSRIADSV